MRISLKVLGILWIGLFLIIGGLLYNAYSKFRPETFIALITEQVQKNYPGTKLEVGKIDYGFSLDFNLNLQEIHLRRSGKLLGSIGKVELKVPWWLLLVNRGNAQINLSNLDIYVDHHDAHEIKAPHRSADKEIKVTLPDYLTDAKYTLRAKEVSIRDIHNSRRYFTISKLLVREFQYGKNSAFELNIPIDITHGQTRYTSNLWLFGDVTPETHEWNFNYRGEFRTKEAADRFQIEDLVIAGIAHLKPQALDVTSGIDLSIDKKTIGRGNLTANQDNLSLDLNFTSIPLSYFSFIYEEVRNPYLKELDGTGVGVIRFDKKFASELASVSGKLSFDGGFEINPTDKIPGKWQLNFQDSRWEISFISPKAELSFFRRSFIDMKKSKETQFVEEIGFTGLDFNHVIAPVTSLGKLMSEIPDEYYSTTISYKDCLQGEDKINGSFKYGFTPDQKFYSADINSTNAGLMIRYSSIKSSQKSLDLTFNKFPWKTSYTFLSPFYQAGEGVLDGKIEGRWTTDWEAGTWLGNLQSKNFKDEQGLIPDLINKTVSFFELPQAGLVHKNVSVSIKNNTIHLNSLMLDNGESAKITGSLSSKGNSFLSLAYPKNKKWKPVKKEVTDIFWKPKEEI